MATQLQKNQDTKNESFDNETDLSVNLFSNNNYSFNYARI